MVINRTYRGRIYEILIDDEDFDFVNSLRFGLVKQGLSKLRVYSQSEKNYLHRLLMKCPKNMSVDHINGNPLDNRKNNLRICTLYENTRNTNKKGQNNTSIYKGVCLDSWAVKTNLKKKWIARIKIDYKSYNLGRYLTEKEAAIAYNNKALAVWGEYAKFNIITE